MHFLLKPLFHLLEPLSLVVLGLAVLTVLLIRRRQRGLAIFSGLIWLTLVLTTCTALSDRMLASIEREWATVPSQWSSLPVCDAVVCLGGGVTPNPAEIIGVGMEGDSNRITTAIELIREGRAPFLMLGGGYADPGDGPKLSESTAVRHWIERWQLVSVPVDDLGICRNTRDEALMFAEKAKLHGWKKIILVTSASHMHRALGVFRKTTGLEVVPVACAFHTDVAGKDHVREWVHMPATGALDFLGTWIYETIGWWTYKARGWV